MLRRGLTFLTFASLALAAAGLRCWTCENADLQGCKRKGTIRQCDANNQESCQTEVRYSEDRTVIIRTGCKQGTACLSNNRQNPAGAWAPTQCNERTQNSVCRCCCAGNLCNRKRGNLLCQFPERRALPTIPPTRAAEKTCGRYPETPENGKRDCIGGYGLRAFCKFSCDDGYVLKGYPMTLCVQRGKALFWNREAPSCEKEDICQPMPVSPVHGYKRCKGDGELGSVCKFYCAAGYELQGPPDTACEATPAGAQWSHRSPTCKKLVCDPMPRPPSNGQRECIGGGELGTTCDFACDFGYELRGADSTTCVKATVGAKWSQPAPQCEKLVCDPMPATPNNGQKECTGDGGLGDVCSFACNFGYQLEGWPATTCEKTRRGMQWSRETPKCKPVCKTLPEEPENGFKSCSGNGELGTVCTFDCKPGHEMRGAPATTCVRRGEAADWSRETPICEPVCKPLPEAPSNGRKKCTGSGEVGTVCDFECDTGYELDGPPQTDCARTPTGADWTSETPVCTFIPICEPMPSSPQNGEKSCSGEGEVGTVCVFECHPGYERNGPPKTTCEMTPLGAGWSHGSPSCTLIPTCAIPPAPVDGDVFCDGNGEDGTVCEFSCREGFEINGDNVTTCQRNGSEAKWTHQSPKCTIIIIEPECPSLGELRHGKITCDNPINREGTICRYQCLEVGYEMVPSEAQTTYCDASLKWTVKKPCCVECTNAKKDIVIAMDSSGSIDPREWKTMLKFVQNIVRSFSVSKDAVQFSIFQFSSSTRSEGSMFFGRHNKYQLIRQVGKMRRLGTGTMTGKALEYARERFGDKGNREGVSDLLLVLTDGATEDMRDLRRNSWRLRRDGVDIIALAIGPTDNFVEQMTKMTGDEGKVLVADDVSSLTEGILKHLTTKICQDPRQCY